MAVTGPQDEPFPLSDDIADWCWQTPSEMTPGRWIEVPVDDGLPRWMRVEALVAPQHTLEERWAVRIGRDRESCWMKVSPWLRFRSVDRDPGGDGAAPG